MAEAILTNGDSTPSDPEALRLEIALVRDDLAQSLQQLRGALDLRAEQVVGMHFGTFDLTDEPLDEPPARFRAEAARRGLGDRAWVLSVGETRAF